MLVGVERTWILDKSCASKNQVWTWILLKISKMLKHRQGAQYSNGQPWPDPTAKEEGLFDKQQPGGFLHLFAIFRILSLFAHLSYWFPGRDILSAAKLEQRSSSFFVSSNLSTSSDQRALQVHQPHHRRQDEQWSLIMSKKRLVIKQMETCMWWKLWQPTCCHSF